MTEMYVENNRVDMSGDFSSTLSYAIDDIKDFASRNCTFSKTIILPGTANNNKLLGHIFDFNVSNPYEETDDNILTNFNAAVSAECIIFQDNIQVFKGIFRLLEIVITNGVPEYEVAVFGELGGLVLAMGNKKLEELDFSDYDLIYSSTNVSGSWDNTPGSGIYFPLIDYANVSTNKIDFDILAFRPAFYVKELLDKIFEDAAYSYESALTETDRFKRLIIPNTQKQLYNRQEKAFEAVLTGVDTFTGTTPELISFNAINIAGGFVASGGNTIFTYTGATIIGNVVVTMDVTDIINASAPPYAIEIKKNGVTIGQALVVFDTPPPRTLTVGPFFTNVETGDFITVQVTPPPGTPQLDVSTTILNVNNTSPQPVQVNAGETIQVNGGLPQNVLQVDFVSSIIKLFNLYLYEDSNSRKVMITPFVDFYETNVSGMVDWTYKLDRSKPIRLKPMSELNSRYYNFNFKPDADYYNEQYQKQYNQSFGDRIYDSGYEFSNDKTDIDVIFSSSPLVGYSGVDKIMVAAYKKSGVTEDAIGCNIRILQSKKVTGVTSWALKNGVSTLIAGLTVYGYAGNYDDPDAPANDIHFGVPKELYFTLVSGAINVTQFNAYWSSYMAEITDKDSKMMTAHFKLKNKDIFDLDFSKPIHIDGSIWRLNKIIDWNASTPDVCVCELLKIINLIY